MFENHFSRWIEIDLDAIIHNFREVRSIVSPKVKIMAVVKSDAYGHGAVEAARALEEAGADMLAVSTVEEGRELRVQGIMLPVLVFSPMLSTQAGDFLKYRLLPTIDYAEALTALARAAEKEGIRAGFHLKVETGMGRNGVLPEEAVPFAELTKSFPFLYMAGIYSHLATAMMAKKYWAKKQFSVFTGVLDRLKEQSFSYGLAHLANSAAVLDLPETHLDLVRTGTLLYGQYPSASVNRKLDLKDPWKVKARVVSVKKLPAGYGIGYGRDYVTKKPVEIGVVPVGYADGFGVLPHTRPVKAYDLVKSAAKQMTNLMGLVPQNHLKYFDKKLSVLGRIGMQMCMVDISGHNIKAGAEVMVSMRRTTASSRLPRLYFKDGQVRAVRNISGDINQILKD